jgi:hypothetical protein
MVMEEIGESEGIDMKNLENFDKGLRKLDEKLRKQNKNC